MFTPEALLDMHRRTHHGNINLLNHCRQLSEGELTRELPGIGFPSVQRQLYHAIDAELYWQLVLLRYFGSTSESTEEMEARWGPQNFMTIDALEAHRAWIAGRTAAFLEGSTTESLATPSTYGVDPGVEEIQVPELVILRIITHYFHHRFLTMAMCRMLGHPMAQSFSDTDYPLEPDTASLGTVR